MATRGPNFTPSEDRTLALAYIHVGQDPVIGNGQRNTRFWERICEHYHKIKPARLVDRSASSLESRLGGMAHDVSKFAACHQQIVDLDESGTNAEDVFCKAMALYKQKHPKGHDFKFVEAWRVLKDYPKFGEVFDKKKPGDSKKRRKSLPLGDMTNVVDLTGGSELDGNSPDENSPEGNYTRPIGNKNAKDSLKTKNSIHTTLLENAKASAQMTAVLLEKVQLMKQDAQMALFAFKEDLDMCDASLEFFNLRKIQELKKFKQSLSTDEIAMGEVPSAASPMSRNADSSVADLADYGEIGSVNLAEEFEAQNAGYSEL